MHKKTLSITRLSGLCLMLLLIINSFASDKLTTQSIGLGFTLQDFGYKEFNDQNTLLDREDGWLPGISASYSRRNKQLLFDANITMHKGNIAYNGQTQGGSPHRTRTDEKIIDASFSLSLLNTIKLLKPADIYFGLGKKEWQRDILATGSVLGLSEIYHWKYGFVGSRGEIIKTNNIVLYLDGRLTRTINPQMNICLLNYDCTDLKLGVSTGFRLSLPLFYNRQPHSNLIVEPYIEAWDFGRSPEKTLTINGTTSIISIHEPRSETQNFGISITLNNQF